MSASLALQHRVAGRRIDGALVLRHDSPGGTDFSVGSPEADRALVAEAVAAARAAADPFAAAGIESRSDVLQRVARQVMERAEPLARLIARETGKTLRDARGEVARAARIFDFFAGEALRNVGERFDSTRVGAVVEVSYAPLGVVGLITPWNFPIAIPAWKLAPALAFGNAVVWKPSERSAAVADALMDVLEAAGAPPGVVNLVLGARAAGEAVGAAEGLDALSFTGSERAGRSLRMAVVERGLKLQQEMGGSNALVVLADADLEVAVDCALNGAFFAAGQRCTATSRLVVDHAVADVFVARLAEATRALVVGDPEAEASTLGPLVSRSQRDGVEASRAAMLAEGAQPVVAGGAREGPGAYFEPALFDHLAPDSLLARDEVFGPVAGVFRVDGLDEALARVNAARLGLSGGVCTRSMLSAERFKREAKVGMAMVNLPTAGVDYHAPFGGAGASSFGLKEQGRSARAFYTADKIAYQRAL